MVTKVVVGALVAGLTLVGAMHLHLTDSFPKADTALSESPGEIRVWFNEEPQLSVSRLGLEGPAGEIELGRAEDAEGMSFKSAVHDTLSAGEYTVSWRTAADDGHVGRGTFTFTVSAGEGH